MARADANTFGLLNRWPLVMSEDVWTFNQLAGAGVRLFANRQNTPYIQSERDYIADALHSATLAAVPYLGFYPVPVWVEGEVVTINRDLHWTGQTLDTRFTHLSEFGRRATTVISAGADVVYSDSDSDGVQDTATITVTTAVDTDEIQVFFRVADGAAAAADARWQVEPLSVSASGGTVTITGHKSLFVHPQNVWAKAYTDDGVAPKYAGDTTDTDSFVTKVDVYRVYADATSAVQLILNPNIVGTSNTPVNVTADIVDSDYGRFTMRVDSSQSEPAMPPSTAKVWYRAGLPLVNGFMDRRLEVALIRYANTFMPQQPAMFDRALANWEDDRKPAETLTPYDAQHPPAFGVTKAGVYLASVVDGLRNRLKGLPVYR